METSVHDTERDGRVAARPPSASSPRWRRHSPGRYRSVKAPARPAPTDDTHLPLVPPPPVPRKISKDGGRLCFAPRVIHGYAISGASRRATAIDPVILGGGFRSIASAPDTGRWPTDQRHGPSRTPSLTTREEGILPSAFPPRRRAASPTRITSTEYNRL